MAICSAFINPLDLECLFINTFAGGITTFIVIALFAIAIMAGFFKMKTFTLVAMFGVFAIMFYPILGSEFGGIYIIFMIAGSMVLIKTVADAIKR